MEDQIKPSHATAIVYWECSSLLGFSEQLEDYEVQLVCPHYKQGTPSPLRHFHWQLAKKPKYLIMFLSTHLLMHIPQLYTCASIMIGWDYSPQHINDDPDLEYRIDVQLRHRMQDSDRRKFS